MEKLIVKDYLERQFKNFKEQVTDEKYLQLGNLKVNGTALSVNEDKEINLEVDNALSASSENPIQNKTVKAALDTKMDKVEGKTLSTNDYTDEDKNKLNNISAGAEANVQADWNEEDSTSDAYIKNKPVIPEGATVDSELSDSSVNPVQNKVVKAALDNKVDKVNGKDLSTNDYTNEDKNKLAGISAGAKANVQADWEENDSSSDAYIKNKPTIPASITVDSELSSSSTNPVQNKIVKGALDNKVDKNGTDSLMTADEHTKLGGMTAGAEPNKINSISLNGTNVAPDANKNVALTVITKAVNDLTNYYLKSETYTKTEINNIVTNVKNSHFKVVSSLPTTDIDTTAIYLIPKDPTQTNNIKEEYINLDGTTAGWEKIGDTEVDLSDYVTQDDLDTALEDYTSTTDLTALLATKQPKVLATPLTVNGTQQTTVEGTLGAINTNLTTKYDSSDTAETTLADDDKVPFYDTSASGKRNSTWANIKAKLKSYFDTLYISNTETIRSSKEVYIRCDPNTEGNSKYLLLYELPNFSSNRATNFPLKVRGNMGISNLRQYFDVGFMIYNADETNGVYAQGFLSSGADYNHSSESNIFVTYNSSDNTVRLYAMCKYADIEMYLTIPDNGTVYENPTATASYIGTIRASLDNITPLQTISFEKSVTLSTSDTIRVEFNDYRINRDAIIDYRCSEWNLFPDNIETSNGTCYVYMPKVDTARTVKIKIYLE